MWALIYLLNVQQTLKRSTISLKYLQTGCEPRIRIDLYTCCSIWIFKCGNSGQKGNYPAVCHLANHEIRTTNTKRTVSGCIFILLHSHGTSWTRLSKKTAVKMTTNHIIIFTSTLRYNAGISHRSFTWQSMNITFTPARIPHSHHQRLYKSLFRFIY